MQTRKNTQISARGGLNRVYILSSRHNYRPMRAHVLSQLLDGDECDCLSACFIALLYA